MSRGKVGGLLAVVLAALTFVGALVAENRLASELREPARTRVTQARELFARIAGLEGLDIVARAERLAAEPGLQAALAQAEPGARDRAGRAAISTWLGARGGTERPDFVAVVGLGGDLAFADAPLPETAGLAKRYPAVAAALEKGTKSKDTWTYGNGVFEVGVSPVVDPATGQARGAVVLAYALNARDAAEQAALLGGQVAYFHGDRLVATSLERSSEAVLASEGLRALARAATQGQAAEPVEVELGEETFLATASQFPLSFADKSTVAVIMESLTRALAPVVGVRLVIILLGVAAFLVAVVAMLFTARVILHPAEEIELGVNEIIHGNRDYVFKPAGADFDGLANALNVMTSTLLGRPEAGPEGFSEESAPGRLVLDRAPARVSNDPDVVALAQEPEAAYFARLFSEYVAARRAQGESVDTLTQESFVSKLRQSEETLQKRYNCRAVRFRVHEKDGLVTLKPVPIV